LSRPAAFTWVKVRKVSGKVALFVEVDDPGRERLPTGGDYEAVFDRPVDGAGRQIEDLGSLIGDVYHPGQRRVEVGGVAPRDLRDRLGQRLGLAATMDGQREEPLPVLDGLGPQHPELVVDRGDRVGRDHHVEVAYVGSRAL
jgi:hypothetical protein